ncbi:MAG: hypothetical protein M3367_18625 [Acidobacteriota bacterium]|nr:hypothetical protein [Acidobacteriota bacterium]
MWCYLNETNRGQILSSAEIFDSQTNNFSLTKTMNVVRYKHDSILLKDNRVLVFGGSDNRDWNGQYKSAEILTLRRMNLSLRAK